MPSFNKTKKHFDDRRTAPFIPGAPVLAAGTLVCSGNWEKTRAKLRPEGESVQLAPASSHPVVPAPLVRQRRRRRSRPGAGAAAPPVRRRCCLVRALAPRHRRPGVGSCERPMASALVVRRRVGRWAGDSAAVDLGVGAGLLVAVEGVHGGVLPPVACCTRTWASADEQIRDI